MRIREIFTSLVCFALLTVGLFPDVFFCSKTVSSAPHIPFTLPDGPVGYPRSARIPLVDPFGPGWIHEASFPFRDRAVRSGAIPFWHPYEACGNPYLAGLLPGLFFPPNWLMHVGKPPLGFDLAYLTRLLLGGWLLYLFLRIHRLRVLAAGLGGALFLGSGYMLLSLNLSNASVECMIPGLLLGLECVVTRSRFRDVLLLAIVVFAVLVGGNPQASFLALVLGGTYAAFRLLACRRLGWRRPLFGLVLGHAVAALAAAPQLLPFLEFVAHGAHLHPAGLGKVAQPWELIVHWIVPGFYDNAYGPQMANRYYFYIGSVAPALAVAALIPGGPVSLKRFSAGALLLIAAWYFGVPGIREIGRLPGFSRIALGKYLAVYLGFLVAILAAVGLDRLVAAAPRAASRALVGGAVLVTAVPVLFSFLWWRGWLVRIAQENLRVGIDDPVIPDFGFLPIGLGLLFLAGLALKRRPGWQRAVVMIVVGVALAEVGVLRPRPYPPRRDIYESPPFLKAVRGDRRTFRIFSPDRILNPNTATIFQLRDIRYAEALKIRRYTRLIAAAFEYPDARNYFHLPPTRPFVSVRGMSLLGVRYCVADRPLAPVTVRPGAGPLRQDLTVNLTGGGGRLVGTLSRPANQPMEVRIWIVEGGQALAASTTIQPGAGGRAAALEVPSSAFPDRLPYLAIHGASGQLTLSGVRWAGERLEPARLERGAYLPGGLVASDQALVVSAPSNVLPLPATRVANPRLEWTGTVRGHAPFRMAVALRKARRLWTLAEAAEKGRSTAPIDIDLEPFAGKRVLLSVQVTGAATLEPLTFVPDGLVPCAGDGAIRVYENTRALPRAYGVYRAEVISEDAGQLERLLAPAFDYRRSVILDGLPEGVRMPASPPAARPGVALIDEDAGGGRIVLDVDFAANGLLVLLDNAYPGWAATVDGNAAPILRANYTFKAVPVPPGRHRVVFAYRPTHWRLGLGLALAGLLLLATGGWLLRRRPSAMTH